MARGNTKSRDVVQAVVESTYSIGEVIADAAFRVEDRHPEGEGPWKMEADKVAWKDPATGMDCIIRRSKRGGYLCGYVGVPPQHPLFGFEGSALEALGIHPHGGVDHGAPCEEWEPEPISVCHVRDQNATKKRNSARAAAAADIDRQHDHAWWFGFSCNKPGDLQPSRLDASPSVRGSRVGLKSVYRNETYVLGHVVDLAAQLHAIGDGLDVPVAKAPAAPARGLDPDTCGIS
jgi:hypothetical protein